MLSYIMSSSSIFDARYLRTLHYNKLRDCMFKGKQYSSFKQLSCSTCYNMSVNCKCCNFIGSAAASQLVSTGNYCRSFQCRVNTVFGVCSCLGDSWNCFFVIFGLFNFNLECKVLVWAGFDIMDIFSVAILLLKYIVDCVELLSCQPLIISEIYTLNSTSITVQLLLCDLAYNAPIHSCVVLFNKMFAIDYLSSILILSIFCRSLLTRTFHFRPHCGCLQSSWVLLSLCFIIMAA
jgi:hypothetical protein